MNLVELFKNYLLSPIRQAQGKQDKKPSALTVKNYVVDVKKFVRWYEAQFNTAFDPSRISPDIIALYKDCKIGTQKNTEQNAESTQTSADAEFSLRQVPAGTWLRSNNNIYSSNEASSKAGEVRSSQCISPRSLERHLSSLRKFFNFLKIEGIIRENPFERKTVSAEALAKADPFHLKDFKNYLYVYNAAHLTIKNYLIDVKQFLKWAEEVLDLRLETRNSKLVNEVGNWKLDDQTSTFKHPSSKNILNQIESSLIEEYKNRLLESGLSPLSINRKLSSIRKYTGWLEEANLVKNTETHRTEHRNTQNIASLRVDPCSVPSSSVLNPTATEQPTEKKERQYSNFPPIRLAQKVTKGINFLFDHSLIHPLAKVVEQGQDVVWRLRGKPVFTTIQNSKFKIQNYNSKFKNLKSYFINHKSVSNIPKEFYAPLAVSTANFSLYKKVLFHARHTRPDWYKRYHSYPITHYFHFAILVVFMSALGFAMYSAFVQRPTTKDQTLAAGGTSPVSPLKILSFQGRLTDASDNPITDPKYLRFMIYNDPTASEAGSKRLWEEVREVEPDTDGIFSVLLGENAGGNAALCNSGEPPASPASGACGIPQSLFANNAALYLGVTVEADGELTPRQQLATVAYATNAEVLQGMPPVTDAGVTTNTNAILALNSSGTLAIGGVATTTFQASSAEFKLTGQPLTLTTNVGSNGNVVINPDGLGKVDIQRPIVNSSLTGNFVPGAVEFNDTLAIIATDAARAALIVNQNTTGGDIFTASSSGATQFVIKNNGNVGIGTTAPTVKLDVDGAIAVQTGASNNIGVNTDANKMFFGGYNSGVSPFSSYGVIQTPQNKAIAIWNESTGIIAAFGKDGAGSTQSYFAGNVGIGTTSPTSKLQVAGNITPEATGTRDLGSSSLYWSTVYANNFVMPVGTGVAGWWQRNAGGVLSPVNATDDLILGATATASSLVKFTGTSGGNSWINTGNVGIGTSVPGNFKLQLTGDFGPSTDSLYNIGSSSLSFFNVFSDFATINRGATLSAQIATDVPLQINDETGSSIFQVATTAVTSNIPANFTSSGDVSMAYDLNFTNPTASYIKSAAPLYIVAGETFGSSDLTLQTYNSGNLVLKPNTGNLWADGGNVGIGTTAPASKVEIASGPSLFSYLSTDANGIDDANIYIKSTSPTLGFLDTGSGNTTGYILEGMTAGGGALRFSTQTESAVRSEKIRFDYNGNIGIGTASPVAKVHIEGADTFPSLRINNTTSGGEAGMRLRAYSGANSLHTDIYSISTGSETGILSFRVPYTANVMTLTSGGYVGIGTTSPGSIFHIAGTGAVRPRISGTTYSILDFYEGTSERGNLYMDYAANEMVLGAASGHAIRLQSNGLSNMVMDIYGNVGIGTTSPAYKLDVAGDVNITGSYRINGTAISASLWAANGNDIYNTNTGNVGIGTSVPTSKLGVYNGNIISRRDDTHGQVISQTAGTSYVPIVGTIRSRGSIASPTAVQSGDILGAFRATGYYDASNTSYAQIGMYASENWSGTNRGSYITFVTTPDAGTAVNEVVRITGSGYVGIGVTNPAAPLDVQAATAVVRLTSTTGTNSVYHRYSSTAGQMYLGIENSAGNDLGAAQALPYAATLNAPGGKAIQFGTGNSMTARMTITPEGNVGIGTTNPLYKLEVNGTTQFGAVVATGSIIPSPTSTYSLGSASNEWLGVFSDFATISRAATISAQIATDVPLQINDDTGSSIFQVATTAVTSNIPANFTSSGDVSMAYDLNFTNPTASYIKSAAPLYIVAGETFGSSDLTLETYNSGNLILKPNSGNLWADGTGVGIGTTSPGGAKLNIKQTSAGTGVYSVVSATSGDNYGVDGEATGTGATNNYGIYAVARNATNNYALYVPNGYPQAGANNYQMYLASDAKSYINGSLGIGITAPNYPLQVAGTSDSDPYIQAAFGNTDGGTYNYGGIGLYGSSQAHLRFFLNGTGTGTPVWQIRAGEAAGTDALSIYSWTKGANVMYFKNDGNVGINTTSPTNGKLEIQAGAATPAFLQSSLDYQLYLRGTDAWAGIRFTDSSATDYIWYNGQYSTFAIGGGGANVSGKKAHIDGGTSIGANYDASSVPANGLAVEGNVGINTTSPADKLDVRLTGASGTWDRFVVTGTNYWGDGVNYITIGAGGASGVMINNPHITWGGTSGAYVRMGRVGAAPSGAYWDAGLTSTDRWEVRRNGTGSFIAVDSGGNLGINATSLTEKLQVNGWINLGTTNGDPSTETATNCLTWGYRADRNPYYCVRTQYKTYGSYTYSRLQLNWHTGIEIGANSSYGGTRFFSEAPGIGGSQIFSVGDGDSNVRVANSLIVNGGYSSNWALLNIGASTSSSSVMAAGSIYSYDSVCVGNNSGHCDSTGGVVIGKSYGTVALTTGTSYFNGTSVAIGATSTVSDSKLHVEGKGVFDGTTSDANNYAIVARNSGDGNTFWVRNDGLAWAGQLQAGTGTSSTSMMIQAYKASPAASYQMLHLGADTAGASNIYYLVADRGSYGDNEFLMTTQGYAYADGSWNGGGADVAEWTPSAEAASLEHGDLLMTDGTSPTALTKKSDGIPYSPRLMGIVSTNPGLVAGNGDAEPDQDHSDEVLVALSGRVPTKVSTENGPIKAGDPLTSSTIPGVAMKATRAGQVVAKALEDYSGEGIGKINTFVNVSFYNPDAYLTSTGDIQITQAATNSANLAYIGDLEEVKQQINDLGFKIYDSKSNQTINQIGAFAELITGRLKAGLVEAENVIVNNALVAQQIYTDKIRINTDDITVAGQNIRDYIVSVVNNGISNGTIQQLNNGTIISPIAEIDQLHTNVISPLASDTVVMNGKLTLRHPGEATTSIGSQEDSIASLQNDIVLEVQNASGSAVASIDSHGNATFSGQINTDSISANQLAISDNLSAQRGEFGEINSDKLTANNVILGTQSEAWRTPGSDAGQEDPGQARMTVHGDANVNGTLRAKNIIADTIEGLEARVATIAADTVYSMKYMVYGDSNKTASNSASLYTAYNILNTDAIDISTFSAQLAQVENLNAVTGVFTQGLMAFGPSSFADVSVTGQLSIGGNLFLADGSINVLGSNLELQSLKQGAISMMGGLVMIDTDGNLKVGGNAEFAQDVKVGGVLSANVISPLPDNDLIMKLPSSGHSGLSSSWQSPGSDSGVASQSAAPQNDNSRFVVQNASGSGVLAFDQKGNITASGSGTFNKLNFSFVSPALAVSDTESIATGSAGTANIKKYQAEITINNPLVTEKSLIYITPTGDTNGAVIYLIRQAPGVSFTVGMNQTAIKEIPFNWMIVN